MEHLCQMFIKHPRAHTHTQKSLLNSFTPWLWPSFLITVLQAGRMVWGVGFVAWCTFESVLIPALLHLFYFIKVHSSLVWMWQSEGSQAQIRGISWLRLVSWDVQWGDAHTATTEVLILPLGSYNTVINCWFSLKVKSLWGTLDFCILPHHLPSASRFFSKSRPMDGFAFAWGRNNLGFPQHIFNVYYRNLIHFRVRKSFEWAGPSQLALWCWLTRWIFLNVYPNVWKFHDPLLSV